MSSNTKRAKGQYYTLGDPFSLVPFLEWAVEANLPNKTILEPFAGANNIVKSLQGNSLCNEFASYDIMPGDKDVEYRDTIESFPRDFSVCVTNPPWLARNSSTRRGLPFPVTSHDDLYKHCLEICLKHCENVAALIPASYLQCGLFRDRLSVYILLHDRGMFNDTDNPVCLALFNGQTSPNIKIFYDNEFVGNLHELESKIPHSMYRAVNRFNDPCGELGFVSFDSVQKPSIRFCDVKEIETYPIKVSSRFFTRISGEFGDVSELIQNLNLKLNVFRQETQDIFLTPFKGIRKDGRYRRRMEFALARKLIDATLDPQRTLFN